MSKHYDYHEACEWFLDGASEGEGFSPGELEPSDAMREAWAAWVEVCRELWAGYAPTPACGFAPEMPEGFPCDAMHTAQGAGVGIDDGCREYSEGMEAELEAMAKALRKRVGYYGTSAGFVRSATYCAYRDFENETMACIPEREDEPCED